MAPKNTFLVAPVTQNTPSLATVASQNTKGPPLMAPKPDTPPSTSNFSFADPGGFSKYFSNGPNT